jgi:hypothetical protein
LLYGKKAYSAELSMSVKEIIPISVFSCGRNIHFRENNAEINRHMETEMKIPSKLESSVSYTVFSLRTECVFQSNAPILPVFQVRETFT